MIPEAASEIFVDFLVRLNDEPEAVEASDFAHPRHEAFLRQLCDRTAARLGGHAPETFVPETPTDEAPLRGLKRSGIYDAVLKEVGDRLRNLCE